MFHDLERWSRGAASAALLASLATRTAFAQPTPPAAAPVAPAAADSAGPDDAAGSPDAGAVAAAADELTPPELLQFAEAEYPAAAREARLEADVELQLDIDAEGHVLEAQVATPAGNGFDEAAQAAALRFVFVPAKRGATPIVARILYTYEFRLPPEPPPAAPAAIVMGLPSGASVPEGTLDVTVEGLSAADERRQSAESVKVIETEQASRQATDLGEILARTEGIGVRREGGLGSSTRFSLNGLTDDQVRFFLDGIPLELAGYPQGIANVPVNEIERVEVYSGVVPVRFGADALGGAVNLVTPDDVRGTHAAASYETGSFDTHRVTLDARHLDDDSGFYSHGSAYFDYAKNDYPVDVEVPDERGRLSPATVHRFHDAYRASGGTVELGMVQRPWARRLLLRTFLSDYDKEYQHNIVMTVPYGEVTYGELSAGASLRYEQPLTRDLTLDATLGYTYTRGHFLDVSNCVYDWFGRCVRERTQPGETDSRPRDQLYWDHSGFGRVNLDWRLAPAHKLRLALAPTYVTRTGDERRQIDPAARDPLTAERKLLTMVNGLEYEFDAFDDRLENIAFVKYYLQQLWSEEPRPGDILRRRDRTTQRVGYGDAVRFAWTPWLYTKLSYEYATRLPRPDEVFGDNAFIVANLELEPETSHNANLGLTLDLAETRGGAWRLGVNGFLRSADQLIVLLGNDRVQTYQNVYGATSTGIESAAGWTSPGEYLALDGNLTYQSFRNTSSSGTFGDFEGDRIPNRPYLFANASARLQFRGVMVAPDELSLNWNTRFVQEYYRGWESVGLKEFKQVIPSQLVHSLAIVYLVDTDHGSLSSSMEVQNLTNEDVYDFFGVQRPGRAFYAKMTFEL